MERIERRDLKFSGATGVVSIVVAAIAGVVVQMWELSGTDATSAEIAASVADDRTLILIGMVLNTTVISLWLVFGAGVWYRLREAARGESVLVAMFALGFVCFVTLLFAGFTAVFLLAYRAPDVSEAKLLYDLTFGLLAMSGMPTAVALTAYAELVFRTGALPRWTAYLAAVAAAAHVGLLASFIVTDGFFSLQGEVIIAIPATLFAWIAGTGYAMTRAEA